MSRMQRTKGATGEREVCRAIHDQLGVRLIRNLEGPRSGGYDLIVHPEDDGPTADALRRFAPEVKRHARATAGQLAQWWSQATEQASRAGLIPVLLYRADRADWRVLVPLSVLRPELRAWEGIEWTADLSLLGFASVIREAI